MMHQQQRKRLSRPMSRTQRACWLFLAFMKSSSGFSSSTHHHPHTKAGVHPSTSHQRARIQSYAPSPLQLVTEEHEDNMVARPITQRKRGPFRRAVRKILRKKRVDEDSPSMHMLTKETELSEEFVKEGLRLEDHVNADFILQNFQNTGPNDIFPASTKERRNLLTSEEDAVAETGKTKADLVTADVPRKSFKPRTAVDNNNNKPTNIKSPKENVATMPTRSKYEGGTLIHRMTRSWFQNLLTGIIQRRSKVPPVGLSVKVAPRAVMKRLCRGQFRCDAAIDFDRVVFRNLRLTGGSLEAKHMTLGVYGGGPRYANQFDIHAHNCTLTEDDLFESSCIRNGLARLLVRILNNAGVTTTKIQMTSVNIVVRVIMLAFVCIK